MRKVMYEQGCYVCVGRLHTAYISVHWGHYRHTRASGTPGLTTAAPPGCSSSVQGYLRVLLRQLPSFFDKLAAVGGMAWVVMAGETWYDIIYTSCRRYWGPKQRGQPELTGSHS